MAHPARHHAGEPNRYRGLGCVVSYGLEFDEVKNGWMGGASAAKTSVLASEATLQTTIFHLTASGGGALLADELHTCFASVRGFVASRKACVLTLPSSAKIAPVKPETITDDTP